MALPLPKVLYDVGPGGGLVTAMGGYNALSKAMLETRAQEIENQYKPITLQAKAASELAYANLLGPQFVAKLMGNPDVVANSPQLQDPSTIGRLVQAGTGGATGANFLNQNPGVFPQVQGGPSSLAGIFAAGPGRNYGWNVNQPQYGSGQQYQTGQQVERPPLPAPPPGVMSKDYAPSSTGKKAPRPTLNRDGLPGSPPISPADYQQAATPVSPTAQERPKDYFEKAGEAQSKKAQAEELGKSRATAISDLGKQYTQDVEAMAPLNRLSQLTQSPVFMNMRKSLPFWQNIQLKGLSKIGNRAEQKMVGDFMADVATTVMNTVNSFNGRAMAKEFDFAKTLKVSDNDTLGVMLGKLESLRTFKQATMERNKIARQLMGAPNYMNEGDAYEKANDSVNIDAIRDKISSELAAPVWVKNTKTNERKLISLKEYNEMLKKK